MCTSWQLTATRAHPAGRKSNRQPVPLLVPGASVGNGAVGTSVGARDGLEVRSGSVGLGVMGANVGLADRLGVGLSVGVDPGNGPMGPPGEKVGLSVSEKVGLSVMGEKVGLVVAAGTDDGTGVDGTTSVAVGAAVGAWLGFPVALPHMNICMRDES